MKAESKKFKWQMEYWGYLAFAVGVLFLLLNSLSIVFVFIALVLYLGGAVFNGIFAIKKYRIELQVIKVKMQEEIKKQEKQNKKNNDEKNANLPAIDPKLVRDIKLYKHELRTTIVVYSAIAILSVVFFIRLLVIA